MASMTMLSGYGGGNGSWEDKGFMLCCPLHLCKLHYGNGTV